MSRPDLLEQLSTLQIFTGLTPEQLAELAAAGEDLPVEPGVEVWHEGDHADFWWVLVDGVIDLHRRIGPEIVRVGRMEPGRWAGGFRAWDEDGVYLASGRVVLSSRLLRIPALALRDLVQEWSPLGGHLIAGLYHTARSIESTARQRDALVTLGTFAAGLAHELNNPAAAATRAVAGLNDAAGTLLAALGDLAEGRLTPEQFAALDALRKRIPGPDQVPDALALADREEEIADWLEHRKVPDAWQLAPVLAAARVDLAWCDEAAAVLDDRTLAPGLVWVSSTLSARALLAEIDEATHRISELVDAARSYSQLDRASRQRTDVVEGIESTLTMLSGRLREVRLQREYAADVPPLDAYAGELNQVWTNLIGNAVDAMDGTGLLTITTRLDGADVVVEIGDTGTGMSPEVAARAFDAFYTTKDVGKGTGLGLDIARRIVVERHGGAIEIITPEVGTVMRVRLPL
ncbi:MULTISPECIES: sensor histidine kinase [unclassified Nocardioides]|uniref:sensor histidine kinase n=1 Tax=unclassified Nocardioides TaxID=2615069 RepID=UPI00361D12A3